MSTPPRASRKPRKKVAPRVIVAFVLGALIAILAVINLDRVGLDLIFGTVRTPLIIVIAISVLIGALLGAVVAGTAATKRAGTHRR